MLNVAEAALPDIRFTANRVENESFMLEGLTGSLSKDGSYTVRIMNAVLVGENVGFTDISVAGLWIEKGGTEGNVIFKPAQETVPLKATYGIIQDENETRIDLNFSGIDMRTYQALEFLPKEFHWLSRGRFDAMFSYRSRNGTVADVGARLNIRDLAFDSPDGRFAADGLAMKLELEATSDSLAAPAVNGSILGGEILVDDFYRDFADGELHFATVLSWDENSLRIPSFKVTDNYSLEVQGRAEVGLGDDTDVLRLEVNKLELKFPGAYERYMEPMAAVLTLDGLEVTGHLSWNGEWHDGSFKSGDFLVGDLSIVDVERHRFAFTGLDAHMRPGNYAFDSKLSWRGLLIGRINLGPGEVALDSEPGKFAIIKPLVLEVMGGRVRLNELSVLLPGSSTADDAEPDIRLKADLEELDMERITAALGWPNFSGKISGHIPGVSLNDGVLDVEGQILVDVFDGSLTLDDLKVERLFGVLPSLSANIEAKNLDLEQLTRTFSFGQISGRIDGFIRDLRMLDWEPVAFDAWFGTPQNQKGSRDISRQAVNHLTTLGGGQATTALTSPVMKLFSNFSYKALGLGCRMQNNICDIRGVSEDDKSVLIMEGAGVPKITIRAFNRRVDWPQLMAQLVAASEADSIKIGD